MKKSLTILLALFFTALTVDAESFDTSSWYQYNGASTLHSYAIKFPTDWKVISINDEQFGFTPISDKEETLFYEITEFEGYTFEQAINFYLDTDIEINESNDIILPTAKEDLIARQVSYSDFLVTFVKRGTLILGLKADLKTYPDIVAAMTGSFKFTDNWHQYIDFADNYAFIFPASYTINSLDNGVEIVDSNAIFTVLKYEDTASDEIAEAAKKNGESFISQESIFFHGLDAITAEYRNNSANKKLSRILVKHGNDYFALTDLNIDENFPHLNYYDEYIAEMLESFEFFDVEVAGGYFTFQNFPDVRDNHPNATAINGLFNSKVINGYPDGTFQPDGEINRAELTKMVVATKVKPDPDVYNNCFPDVKEEWFAPYICYAKEREWVEGYPNGKFKPEANVNRVEALKIILQAIFDGVPSKDVLHDDSVLDIDTQAWYAKYFIFADNKDLLDKQHIITDNDGYYYLPEDNMTRKEVAETIYRAQDLN